MTVKVGLNFPQQAHLSTSADVVYSDFSVGLVF